MGIDLRDIVDVLPFVIENPSSCLYIIIVSFIAGFIIGKRVENNKSAVQIQNLAEKNSTLEKEIATLKEEKKFLEEKLSICSSRCEIAQYDAKKTLNVSPLCELKRVTDLNEGEMDITALIELHFKSEKNT